MRWLFLLFLVLNLFYYVWHQQQAPLRAKEVAAVELRQGSQQGVRLLSSADRQRVRPELASVPEIGAGESCLFLGSFQQAAEAQAEVDRLTEEVRALQAERKQVRSRIEKLLGQIDQLSGS